ncbi:MAG: FAD-dependent oxidoreductase [Verrucomicrobia bacterium]|nr:FAD-dependent oxidoreductase [Verrucomicrobiota bacterium]
MKTIKEAAREVPVVFEADVVVVGGSCTGVFAAVRAARLGMRVAIIEKQNCFGGTATAGDVNIWHSLDDTTGKRPIIGGLTLEVIDRLRKRKAVDSGGAATCAFRLNTEELKIELDELITENHVTPFLHTFYAAPVMEGDTLQAVIIENKNGRQAIGARQYVDATGDADLALDLGLPSFKQGSFQPPTTCAKIHGMKSLGKFNWEAAVCEHGAEFGLEPDWGWGSSIPGIPDLQMRADTHVFNTDVSDATQLTRAEIEGRRRVRALMDIIRKYGPADPSIGLADLAAAIGARETSRIEARYRMTGDDLLSGRRFDDAIGNGSYPVDTHHSDGPGITFRYLDGTEKVIPARGVKPISGRWRDPLPEDPTFYQIPFRCITQERVPNLVLAGRMLDADKTAFSALRVMVNMNQTGEAAGAACALAIESACPISKVDTKRLRKILADGGSIML